MMMGMSRGISMTRRKATQGYLVTRRKSMQGEKDRDPPSMYSLRKEKMPKIGKRISSQLSCKNDIF